MMFIPQHNNIQDNDPATQDSEFKAGYEAMLKLPKDALLQRLITNSRLLLELSQMEADHLSRDDLNGFMDVQGEKAKATSLYAQCCRAFHKRIEAFRDLSDGTLKRIEHLQNEIGDIAARNNKRVSALMGTMRENTCATLFAAQEIGQIKETQEQDLRARTNPPSTSE